MSARIVRVTAALCFLLLSLAPATAAPQAPSVITGRVADATGLPVPGAPVVLTNLSTRFERVGVTDGSGEFAFAGLTPGTYRVMASLDGFKPASADVDTGARVALALVPSAYSEQVTVVSGSRQEALRESLSTPVTVVTRERLAETGRSTVGDVLREVPGVVSRRGSEASAAAGQQVQGIDSRQVLVLVDGQPVAGARGIKSGAINLDRQTTHRLDRVEVVKGAASALFGSDAIGGVINLIPRGINRREADVSTAGGEHGRRDLAASFGLPAGAATLFASAGRSERDAFDLTPTTADTTGAAFTRTDVFGRARVAMAPSLRATLTGSAYRNRERGRVFTETGLQQVSVEDEAIAGGASAQWVVTPRTTLEARAYATSFDESSANSTDTLHESLSKADVTLTRAFGERQLLQVGVEASVNAYGGRNRLRDETGHEAETAVIWAQDRINAGSRVALTLGGRYDRHSIFGSAFSPKAAVNARVTNAVRVRASYGEGFRAPDLGQLFYRFVPAAGVYQVVGNPDLGPESSESWQAGADYAPSPRVRVGVNAFHNEVDNLIEAVSLGFLTSPAQRAALLAREGIDPAFAPQLGRLLFVYRNVREVVTQGIELDGQADVGRGFQVAGAYTWLDAVDGQTRAPLAGRHAHQGSARATWVSAARGMRAEVRGTFFSSWIATAGRGGSSPIEEAPAFALWDVYAAKTVRFGVELFGAIDNVTDSRDPNSNVVLPDGSAAPIYRPEIGRAARVGVRWSSR